MSPADGGAVSAMRRLYADPHALARRAKAAGARICGYIGADVPAELIAAAGLVPIRLRGDAATPPVYGDRYGHLAEPVTRSLLERLVNRTYDYLDALIVDHSIEAHVNLFFNLRQTRLMLPDVRLPELHFLDVLHLPHLTTARYNRDRLRDLAATLERWSGHPIDGASIAREISGGNSRRSRLTELAALRTSSPPSLSGVDALTIIGCGMLVPPDDYDLLLNRVLKELAGAPGISGRRVFVTGSAHESPDIYQALEREGCVIVGEDHDWGDRYYADEVDENAYWLDALADRAAFGAPAAAKYGLAERVSFVSDRVRETGAEVLLSINRVRDDAARWEFPDLEAALTTQGIVCMSVDEVPYDTTAAAVVADHVRSLVGATA